MVTDSSIYVCGTWLVAPELIGSKFGYLTVLRRGVKPSCGCAAVEAVIKSNTARTGQQCMHPIRRSLSERCWEKVNKNGPMPTTCSPEFGVCWLWTAADWGRG